MITDLDRYATFCTILSLFAMVILGFIALFFSIGAAALVDGLPEDISGKDAAATCISAVIVYAVFFVFCGSQVWLSRQRGQIQL